MSTIKRATACKVTGQPNKYILQCVAQLILPGLQPGRINYVEAFGGFMITLSEALAGQRHK